MTKYKVNINRPKISTEEIVQQKDFNGVLKKYKREKHTALKISPTMIYIILLVLLIIIFLAVGIIKDIENDKNQTKENATTEVLHLPTEAAKKPWI